MQQSNNTQYVQFSKCRAMKLPAKNILDRIIITGIGFQHKTNHRAI